MAGDAVLEVLDAFLLMFGAHLVGLMLMASVAGVTLVVIARMARQAGRLVVLVEDEELAVPIASSNAPRTNEAAVSKRW